MSKKRELINLATRNFQYFSLGKDIGQDKSEKKNRIMINNFNNHVRFTMTMSYHHLNSIINKCLEKEH